MSTPVNWRRLRTIAAWILLIGSLIGWPVSALTWANDEPPFVLGLSWLAIVLTAADLLATSQVHEETGETDNAAPAGNVPAMNEPPPPVAVTHVYLSTGCLHGRHDHCQAMVGTTGDKRPATCKFCDARCVCHCHDDNPDTRSTDG